MSEDTVSQVSNLECGPMRFRKLGCEKGGRTKLDAFEVWVLGRRCSRLLFRVS